MTDKPTQPIELRDRQGKLYGKLAGGTLEIKRDGKIVRFDLTTGKPIDSTERAR